MFFQAQLLFFALATPLATEKYKQKTPFSFKIRLARPSPGQYFLSIM